MTRSFDLFHVNSSKVHLICSVFYTNKDLISNISKSSIDDSEELGMNIIIRVLFRNDYFLKIEEHSNNSVEFYCSISNFMSHILKNGVVKYLDNLMGEYNSKIKSGDNILNNVYFVFCI